MTERRRNLVTIAAALLIGMASTAHAADAVHEYVVTVDGDLARLHVDARFAHRVTSVSARSRNSARYLAEVGGCEEQPGIRLRNRRLMLPQQGIECLNYTFDLGRAAQAVRNNRTLDERNIIVSSSYWLWRPELFNGTRIRIAFDLPDGLRVSVPWTPVDDAPDTYLLGRSPESANAPVVFGRFDYRELEVPGATLRVSLLHGGQPMRNDAIANWIQATATDVSLAYGRFPNPSPQVVVIPVGSARGSGRSAVPFGRVVRDGGESVELFVDQSRSLDELLADWTATHEFSHMMVPYIHREHRWISEGFAQYYQNVLLTRAGAYDERHAWQKLYEGYERGRRSRPELSPNEASAGRVRSSLMKVYWSGAALALMADVELRARSNGETSLDTVLEEFQQCCLPSATVWSGQEFFARLDSFVETPVFMPLYRRYADTAGFPDVSETFARLGVVVDDGRVRLKNNAALSALRRDITRLDSATARWRAELATD